MKVRPTHGLWLFPVALSFLVVPTAGANGPELTQPPVLDDGVIPNPEKWDRLYVTTPETNDASGPPTQPRNPAPRIVYVNMDGANLSGGGEDSRSNQSWIAGQYGFTGAYPVWGGNESQRQSLLDAVKADWAPFNVSVVDQRPNSGNYSMCMTGPANHPFGNGVLGIAPLDCNDANKNNITFAFHSASQLGGWAGATTQATTIGQEVAHGYGLEHVTGNGATGDIMYPSNSGGNPSFQDVCYSITGGVTCGSQHQQRSGCGSSSIQNSYQELISYWGPAMPDTEDPTVAITSPDDGATFPTGTDFDIVVDAQDDVEIASVELFVNGQSAGSLTSGPYEWPAMGIPEGTHEFYAIAADTYGNEAESAVITIYATEDGGESGGDGDGDGDSGGDGDGGDGSGSGDGGGSGEEPYPGDAFPPGFGQDAADTGCACSTDGDAPVGLGMLMLLLGAPLLRRRD